MEYPTHRSLLDAIRIDVQNGEDVHYWAELLGVNDSEVRCAVQRVGTGVVPVMRYLEGITAQSGYRRQ